MSTIGVVGNGVVGERCARLLAGEHSLVVQGRRPGMTERIVASLGGARAVQSMQELEACDVVVLAQPAPHAELATRLIRNAVSVVSVAGSVGDIADLLHLDELARQHHATLVVGAGMSPGLSGLLARWIVEGLHVCDELHVAVHGTAGPACAKEHHRALGNRAIGWHDDRWIERRGGSGRELCWFPEPVGAYDCYRAEMAEPITLHRVFPGVRRISARISATRRDRLTSRLPMLSPPHREGGVGALRVEARGADADGARVTLIVGVAERAGTAAAATASAFTGAIVEGDLPPGLIVPGDDLVPTTEVLLRVETGGVRLQGFTGVPGPRSLPVPFGRQFVQPGGDALHAHRQ